MSCAPAGGEGEHGHAGRAERELAGDVAVGSDVAADRSARLCSGDHAGAAIGRIEVLEPLVDGRPGSRPAMPGVLDREASEVATEARSKPRADLCLLYTSPSPRDS